MPLDENKCDHRLSGTWIGHRECHIKPDMLLVYKEDDESLFLEHLESHAALFKG
jgi:mRNA interferase YafQ